jgi:polyphosphate glucokinase
MSVLVVDVGGTHVKCLVSGRAERRRFESGPTLTPRRMLAGVKKLTADWGYERVAIGYPGLVLRGRIAAEPFNLGTGWIGFDFEKAFRRPVKLANDAAMQALGSYRHGTMLFLGLGTGLGSALVVDGVIVPMELAHLPYRDATVEDYVGLRGLERCGRKKWRRHVEYMIERFVAAIHPDDIVIGGGNVKKLKALPAGCRAGSNANAFLGGFRLWEGPRARLPVARRAGERPD